MKILAVLLIASIAFLSGIDGSGNNSAEANGGVGGPEADSKKAIDIWTTEEGHWTEELSEDLADIQKLIQRYAYIYYIVKPGDRLGDIAGRHNTDGRILLAVPENKWILDKNRIPKSHRHIYKNPADYILPGQVILIPQRDNVWRYALDAEKRANEFYFKYINALAKKAELSTELRVAEAKIKEQTNSIRILIVALVVITAICLWLITIFPPRQRRTNKPEKTDEERTEE